MLSPAVRPWWQHWAWERREEPIAGAQPKQLAFLKRECRPRRQSSDRRDRSAQRDSGARGEAECRGVQEFRRLAVWSGLQRARPPNRVRWRCAGWLLLLRLIREPQSKRGEHH